MSDRGYDTTCGALPRLCSLLFGSHSLLPASSRPLLEKLALPPQALVCCTSFIGVFSRPKCTVTGVGGVWYSPVGFCRGPEPPLTRRNDTEIPRCLPAMCLSRTCYICISSRIRLLSLSVSFVLVAVGSFALVVSCQSTQRHGWPVQYLHTSPWLPAHKACQTF